MKLRFHADDFTGASDVILQCRKNGMNAAIVDDLDNVQEGSFDGLASTVRSMSVGELNSYLPSVLDRYIEEEPSVFLYKVCSTFDSSPTIGSIGRAIEIIREKMTQDIPVVVLPAQPGFGRYTSFGNHFAVATGGVYRLDRHPVMSVHPSTPMSESDLRNIIADQGIARNRIELVNFLDLRNSPDKLKDLIVNGKDLDAIVVDTLDESDLDLAAKALVEASNELARTVAVVGSGGIAGALSRTATAGNPLPNRKFDDGPVLALSGSRSPVTSAQISRAIAADWLVVDVNAAEVVSDAGAVGRTFQEAGGLEALDAGRSVVVELSESEAGIDVDPAKLAQNSGGAYADLIRLVAKQVPHSRIMVLGGDTSSWTVSDLGPTRIQVASEFVQAGPIVTFSGTELSENMPIVLKGGQVGGPNTLIDYGSY